MHDSWYLFCYLIIFFKELECDEPYYSHEMIFFLQLLRKLISTPVKYFKHILFNPSVCLQMLSFIPYFPPAWRPMVDSWIWISRLVSWLSTMVTAWSRWCGRWDSWRGSGLQCPPRSSMWQPQPRSFTDMAVYLNRYPEEIKLTFSCSEAKWK